MSLSRPHERSSFLLLPFAAFGFFLRNQLVFWIAAFPVAVVAATLAYFLPEEDWVSWPLFTLVYALFLDRWQKIALLEDAPVAEETDTLRHSVIGPRFLLLAIGAYALGLLVMPLPMMIDVVLWSLIVAPLVLLLASLSAGEGMSLGEAWRLGRPVQFGLLALVLSVALLSALAHEYVPLLNELLPPRKAWTMPVLVGLARLADCLLLALAGHMVVSIYRALSGWQPPEPDDRPYRFTRRRSS